MMQVLQVTRIRAFIVLCIFDEFLRSEQNRTFERGSPELEQY